MYRTNTDLEESILRIFFFTKFRTRSSLKWCSASQRSVYPVLRVDPFFSARSFHVFWAGSAFSSPLFCHPIASGTSRKGLGLAFPLF